VKALPRGARRQRRSHPDLRIDRNLIRPSAPVTRRAAGAPNPGTSVRRAGTDRPGDDQKFSGSRLCRKIVHPITDSRAMDPGKNKYLP
jgi:hypothetical protein